MILQPRKPVRRFTGLVGLPPEPTPKSAPNSTLVGTVVSEDELRYQFGVEERKTKPQLPESYRKFFGLEPDDLIGFFDTQIGSFPELTQIDFIVPPSMIQHRLRRLQKIIHCANEIIEGLSVTVMKVRRGRENVLDKPTREKYKREEQARLARCYAKRAKYYAAAKQEKYIEKVWRVIDRPLLFRDVVDEQMFFKNVEKRWLLELINFQFDLTAYKKIMTLGVEALEELGETDEEAKDAWANLLRWENAVIAAAVAYRVISPPREKCGFLGLTKYVRDLNNQIFIEDEDQGSDESARMISASGANGEAHEAMRVQSGGFWYRANGKPVPRSITSFDRPAGMALRG